MLTTGMNLKRPFSLFGFLVCLSLIPVIIGCKKNIVQPIVPPQAIPPSIAGFAPSQGKPGDTITVTGAGLVQGLATDTLEVNGAIAVITQPTSTSLRFIIPDTATSGKITLMVKGKLATSSTDLVILQPDIYIVGNASPDGTNFAATLWKNGVASILPNPFGASTSQALKVVISGTDVNVLGYAFNGTFLLPVVWHNGIPTELFLPGDPAWAGLQLDLIGEEGYEIGSVPVHGVNVAAYSHNSSLVVLGGGLSSAYSVTAAGNDFYAAGSVLGDTSAYYDAVIWKNGVQMVQPNPTPNTQAGASKVYVSENDVYVAGESNGAAVIWKNGVPGTVAGIGTITDVVFSGPDYYAIGNGPNASAVWKNGVYTSLINPFGSNLPSNISQLIATGNNVYAVGFAAKATHFQAVIWKNWVPAVLQNPFGDYLCEAVAGASAGTAIYSVGFAKNASTEIAMLWKNGTAVPLAPASQFSYATAVALSYH